jgi:hypothetical protein
MADRNSISRYIAPGGQSILSGVETLGTMSKLMSELLKQCRKPTGWFGGLVAWWMNIGHSELTCPGRKAHPF